MQNPSIKEAANAGRLARCREIFEALCIEDPEAGELVPVFEPDPERPGSYRRTARSREIEGRSR